MKYEIDFFVISSLFLNFNFPYNLKQQTLAIQCMYHDVDDDVGDDINDDDDDVIDEDDDVDDGDDDDDDDDDYVGPSFGYMPPPSSPRLGRF